MRRTVTVIETHYNCYKQWLNYGTVTCGRAEKFKIQDFFDIFGATGLDSFQIGGPKN